MLFCTVDVGWKGNGKNARQAECRQGGHHTIQGHCEDASLERTKVARNKVPSNGLKSRGVPCLQICDYIFGCRLHFRWPDLISCEEEWTSSTPQCIQLTVLNINHGILALISFVWFNSFTSDRSLDFLDVGNRNSFGMFSILLCRSPAKS